MLIRQRLSVVLNKIDVNKTFDKTAPTSKSAIIIIEALVIGLKIMIGLRFPTKPAILNNHELL